jgi:sortase A
METGVVDPLEPAAPRTLSLAEWAERSLLAVGLALTVWWLLAAAQMRFYASLPVPAAPVHAAQLPGEGGTHRPMRSGRVEPGAWLAKLEAPAVGLTATVLEGSSDRMLARAAGHIEETPLPGDEGNVGIAGHRDTTFRAVRDLKVGDIVRITTRDRAFEYRVEQLFIVNPDDVYVLDPTPTPALTLVTCYPFTFVGHAPKRYIVRALRLPVP